MCETGHVPDRYIHFWVKGFRRYRRSIEHGDSLLYQHFCVVIFWEYSNQIRSVCGMSQGGIKTILSGLRMVTVLLHLETSIPTAFINRYSFECISNGQCQFTHCLFKLLGISHERRKVQPVVGGVWLMPENNPKKLYLTMVPRLSSVQINILMYSRSL